MASQLVIDLLEKQGFLLIPSPSPTPLGYNDLLILMQEDRVDSRTDPQAIHCWLGLPEMPVTRTVIKPKSEFELVHHVGVGPIHWINRLEISRHFFTFGCALSAEHLDSKTIYRFQSSVPILTLRDDNANKDVGSQFAIATEAMLARKQARSGMNDLQFWSTLANKSPKSIYLEALRDVYAQHKHGSDDILFDCVEAELDKLQ